MASQTDQIVRVQQALEAQHVHQYLVVAQSFKDLNVLSHQLHQASLT